MPSIEPDDYRIFMACRLPNLQFPQRGERFMLFRNKCSACDYWTVFELKVDDDKAVKICTHCQTQEEIPWDSAAETLIKDGERDIRLLEGQFPVLAQLKNRGDHVRL
jgi:hypothetical protein